MGVFDIPKGEQQLRDTERMLIRSFGLNLLKTEIYRPGIKHADNNFKKSDDPLTPELSRNDYQLPNATDRDKPVYTQPSMLGTEVFSNLTIEAGNYYDENGLLTTYEGLNVDTCLFNVRMEKHIVSTPIQGRNGSVIQHIGDKNYLISVKGLICGENGKFPERDFLKLVKILKSNATLKVNSWFLAKFDIFNLVVDNYEIPQEMGKYSTIAFMMNCLSDQPIEFQILK